MSLIEKGIVRALLVVAPLLVAGCAAAPTPEQEQAVAEAKALSGDEIKATLIGNTLSGVSKKGPRYEETYMADGSIRGLWAGKDKYSGKWYVQGDKLCLDYVGSDDEDGCTSASLNGDKFYWLNDDGSAYNATRPATLVSGNPDNL